MDPVDVKAKLKSEPAETAVAFTLPGRSAATGGTSVPTVPVPASPFPLAPQT